MAVTPPPFQVSAHESLNNTHHSDCDYGFSTDSDSHYGFSSGSDSDSASFLMRGMQVLGLEEVVNVAASPRALKRVLPTSPEEAELICEILADE